MPPDNLTQRTLSAMAQGRQRSEWNRTSALLAMVFNAHRAGGTAAKPSDFNPFKQEAVMVIGREDAKNIFRQIAEGKPIRLPQNTG